MPPKRWNKGFCGIILDEPSGFYKMYNGKRTNTYCACDKRLSQCRSEYCAYVARTKLGGLKVGGDLCKHGTRRSFCRHVAECGGGGSYCEHGTRRSECRVAECGGGGRYCEHLTRHGTPKVRNRCDMCSPEGYIVHLRRQRRYNAFISAGADKSTRTLGDLGMSLKDWCAWLAESFRRRYGRDPRPDEEVHIDEIIPCSAWTLPDDNKYCWHYMNSQLLTEGDNLAKNAKYSEEDKKAMISRIDGA
jgi:hypothetical protein